MPQTILIAATDPNIVYLLQRYAEATGFRTIETSPDKDVQELAQQMAPALIILENDFPGRVLLSVLERLKAASATCKIPIVLYSCLDTEPSKPFEGVAGYLLKSVRYDDFLAVLKQAGMLI